ncbi:transcription termination factor NusA [Chloroflexota bacterium]
MKSDFLIAITQLSAEKNLPKDVVIGAIEAALVSAYRKDNFAVNQNIVVKINPNSGKVEVWAEKTVTETPSDTCQEISLAEAKKVNPDAQIEDLIMVEATPHDAGRIAAQTAKQVILQRLHEAEHSAIVEEYSSKEDDVVTGVVQRLEPGQITVDLGRAEAILPAVEQIRNERYRVGQRTKVLILQVVRTAKGPRVVVSRSHPDLLRRLFEMEVPEIYSGAVELKAIAREAGYRSKVAVAASQEGIDPVGCCVGLRGIRIQNVVAELNGEKIDVVLWNPDTAIFIANALSPAHIISVGLDEASEVATVVVPDKQLSLAIGKEGQNARLAAKLTGWRIDIKSASVVEAERLAAEPPAPSQELEEDIATEAIEEVIEAPIEEIPELPIEMEPVLESTKKSVEEPDEEPEPDAEEIIAEEQVIFEPLPVTEEKFQIRFAEDIMPPKPAASTSRSTKSKKKRKGTSARETAVDGIKVKRARRGTDIVTEEEDDEDY